MTPAGSILPSDAADEACLQVKGFVRRYAADATVGPISFEVQEGEFFSLLGPSGCGKTTTLRAIAGFEKVDGGEILLRGKRLDTVPANRRGVGLVFQRHALFPHLRVRENIAFGLRQHGVPAAERDQRVARAMDLVGLGEFAERWPSQLSGGQQQRVSLARSLVMEPPLLLLDEPLSSLDLKLRVQMREEIRGLQKRLNKTTIFVTHDQTEALAMSDRIAVLSDGHIEQIGTPREIYEAPKTRFVAEFIGSANSLTVVAVEHSGDDPVITSACGLRLALPAGTSAAPGSLLFVRPERIRFAFESEAGAPNVIAARILDESYFGDDIEYRIETENGTCLRMRDRSDWVDAAVHPGDQCRVAIRPEAIYVLH